MCILLYIKISVKWLCIYLMLFRGRGGISLPFVYVHSAIHKTFSMYWFCIDLLFIRGRGGTVCSWVYVHSALYETD